MFVKAARVMFALCLVVLTFLSLWPIAFDPFPTVEYKDKIEHFIAYAAVGFLGRVSFPDR